MNAKETRQGASHGNSECFQVKTLYQFVKLSPSETCTSSIKVDANHQTVVSASKASVTTAASVRGHCKVESCLRMLGAAGENDQLERMLLKFWLNGLSSKYKKHQMKLLAADRIQIALD